MHNLNLFFLIVIVDPYFDSYFQLSVRKLSPDRLLQQYLYLWFASLLFKILPTRVWCNRWVDLNFFPAASHSTATFDPRNRNVFRTHPYDARSTARIPVHATTYTNGKAQLRKFKIPINVYTALMLAFKYYSFPFRGTSKMIELNDSRGWWSARESASESEAPNGAQCESPTSRGIALSISFVKISPPIYRHSCRPLVIFIIYRACRWQIYESSSSSSPTIRSTLFKKKKRKKVTQFSSVPAANAVADRRSVQPARH